MAELNGDVPAEERIVQLDSLVVPEGFVAKQLEAPAAEKKAASEGKAESKKS